MVAALVLLLTTLAGAIALATININTAASFQSGYVLNNLANIQRKVIELHIDTNRVLRDRVSDFEPLMLHRDSLQRQLKLARAEMSGDLAVSSELRNVEMLLDHYTYELNRLAGNPTDAQFASATAQIDNVLGLLESKMESLYGGKEREFYANIEEAIRLQRTSQALTAAIGGLLLVFGGLLVVSIRRSVSGEFARAYNLLILEVAERRRAEAELRQHNAYLAALHETSLALTNRLDSEDLLAAIVYRAAQMLHTEHGYACLLDNDSRTMVGKVGVGLFAQQIGQRVEPGQGLAGQVWARGTPVITRDYAQWAGNAPITGDVDRFTSSAIGVPLRSGEQIVGVISLVRASDQDGILGDREIAILDGFAQLASIALDNARLFAEAEQRALHVDALYRADQELVRHLDLSSVVSSLVDVAVDILRADKSMLIVWDDEGERYVPAAARGFQLGTLPVIGAGPEQQVLARIAQGTEAAVVMDTGSDDRADWPWVTAEGIRSLISVPITVQHKVFGVFNVSYTRPHAFNAEDIRLVVALAQRAVGAIENARLYEQAQEAAAIEERQRLARELHDAVTQTLFSASIIADILPRLWDADPQEARRRLIELRELTRGALAEMRALLLELRPHVFADTTIVELLQQLAEATVGRARVPVEVIADRQLVLPTTVKIAFYRIAQEALNNMAKHANATQARVSLSARDGAELSVSDDGIGFDLSQVMPDNLGLCIMRERAESIGATLDITSHPGQGTMVKAHWPGDGAVAGLVESQPD